eukprot:CAMPEP_0197246614 /NCGR_PEP_ID=MMETSP1429-20130617/18388_1 /TAXON_ID=49237 /ORGANISM="Chaetoceros  sp., Strain UNC1202" /LENGTH=125 /DNA_ID=CAMNT_0042707319 /DNA_START=47 /DNA_END=424 /DNA_ORIENTATION=-
MKLSAVIILAAISNASAFAPTSQARVSSSLSYGWDDYAAAKAAPAAPAAPVAPAAPAAPAAAAAPPAAAPAAPVEAEEDVPMSLAWAAKVDYDRSEDIFPTFPANYRTFDEIWAEFQADKAAGRL